MQILNDLDIKLFIFLNNLAGQSSFLDAVVIFAAKYLQPILIVLFVLFLFFSHYSRAEKIRIFWVSAMSVVISRFVITELIRFFYHRPRPFLLYQVHQLVSKNVNTGSFPSGHATFFFAMATAIYFYNKKWGLVFLIAAILMNISRVIAGIHYPSDIIGGVAVGIISAYAIYFVLGKIKKIYGH